MTSSVACPPDPVLAAFGVTDDPVVLPGGKGGTWRAGRLVLKPVEFLAETLWRAEVLTGLPDSTQFRVARPVRALDGAWVVQGWEACQMVAGAPDVSRQDDVLRAGIAFHAAIADLPRPAFLDLRDDPWDFGDRVAWEELPVDACPAALDLLAPLVRSRRPVDLASQVVHGDLRLGWRADEAMEGSGRNICSTAWCTMPATRSAPNSAVAAATSWPLSAGQQADLTRCDCCWRHMAST